MAAVMTTDEEPARNNTACTAYSTTSRSSAAGYRPRAGVAAA